MRLLKMLAWIVLASSLGWLVYEPGFEPGIACFIAVSSLIGLYVKDRQRAQPSIVQNQKLSGKSRGTQVGGNLNVGSTRSGDNE